MAKVFVSRGSVYHVFVMYVHIINCCLTDSAFTRLMDLIRHNPWGHGPLPSSYHPRPVPKLLVGEARAVGYIQDVVPIVYTCSGFAGGHQGNQMSRK